MTSSNNEPDDAEQQQEQQDSNNDNNNHTTNNNDLVIRDGFPALHLANGQGPNVDSVEPVPRHSVWAETHTFSWNHDTLHFLRQDATLVFTARTRDDHQAYSAGTTYFWPCRMPPRCALEALVQSIFECHTRDLDPAVYVPEESGAEWWTLVLDDEEEDEEKQSPNNNDDDDTSSVEGDEVGLHFDADYGLEDQVPNLMLHPRLATVTYLTDYGSPTVIWDQKSPPMSDVNKTTLHGSVVRRGWLSHPVTGKHLAFDGRLLHGAPATFFPARHKKTTISPPHATSPTKPGSEVTEPIAKRQKVSDNAAENNNNNHATDTRRVTLLVNIWLNHCPLDAEPLEEETIQQLKCPFHVNTKANGKTNGDADSDKKLDTRQLPAFSVNPSLDLTQPRNMPKVTLVACPDNPAGSEEVVIGGRLVTVHYGASIEDFHQASLYGVDDDNALDDMLELELGSDVLVLEVGDAVEKDDDVEEA